MKLKVGPASKVQLMLNSSDSALVFDGYHVAGKWLSKVVLVLTRELLGTLAQSWSKHKKSD